MGDFFSKIFDFFIDDENKIELRNKIYNLIKSKKIIITLIVCVILGTITYVTYTKKTAILITKITLSDYSITMCINESKTLIPTVLYSDNSKDKNVIWTSSNESVATIDETGVILALSEGVTTITAQASKNNSVEYIECEVIVQSTSNDIELPSLSQNSQSPPSGYSISIHQVPTVDSYAFIYVVPYDDTTTQIQIYGKSPSGTIYTPKKDANDFYHFYSESGTWTIYASLENEFGRYEAHKPEDFVYIDVTNTTDILEFSMDLFDFPINICYADFHQAF